MIEQIQKYKIIITLSIVAVAAGFVLGSYGKKNMGGGGTAILKIAGRTYDNVEYERLGLSSFKLAAALAQPGELNMINLGQMRDFSIFLNDLTLGETSRREAPEKFFIGRMILRKAKEEFGVYPGDREIEDYVKSMGMFADKDGHFNFDTFHSFVAGEDGVSRFGLGESDLRDLISDMLVAKKISVIVGSGLTVSSEITRLNNDLDSQQIDGDLGRLSLDPFEAKIEPTATEDLVKAYWTERQDAFMTDELRKFTYFVAAPVMPPDAAADKPEAPETLAEAAATDDAKKAAAKKKEEEKAKRTAEIAETRRKEQGKLDKLVDDFTFDLEQKNVKGTKFDKLSTDFEELAKANQWELKTTELFPRSKPPADLDLKLRKSGGGGKVVEELFHIESSSDPLSKFSKPTACGENQWLVARLDEVVKSRPKTFDEAKIEARSNYIHDKGTAAMKAAADEAVAKIKAALAAGKSFADAAKDAGVSEAKTFAKVDKTYRADTATEPKNLFDAARNVDPGALADPIIESDRAFILRVAKRVKDPAANTGLDAKISADTRKNEDLAFTGWINSRVEAAKVQRLNRQ